MDKSIFRVPKMDCAAEENLIRLQLDNIDAVRLLDFDLSARELVVFHEGELDTIRHDLEQLGLGSSLIETGESYEALEEELSQRSLLWKVLAINFGFFILELTGGFIASSLGLIADSLDMLADAMVYGLSLLAVGSTVVQKKRVAKWSGYFQVTLAVLGFSEVLRRFFVAKALPDFRIMISLSLMALVANGICLYLLQRSKSREAHMRASMIFTSNDIVINLGVVTAGLLVIWLNSGIPDLIVGGVVFVIVSLGAMRILRLAR